MHQKPLFSIFKLFGRNFSGEKGFLQESSDIINVKI